MAIVFIKNLPEDKLLLAYVNNIIEFNSDSVSPTLSIVKGNISFYGISIDLYPLPTGKFYFNFKEWITTIINSDNFKDDLQPDLDSSFVYDWTSKVYLQTDITLTVTFNDSSTETATKSLKWISGYVQLEEFKKQYPINPSIDDVVLLHPFVENSNRDSYFKYWSGYPFDITAYTGDATTLTIANQNNLLEYDFDAIGRVNRIVFSDGRLDVTIDDVISLVRGINVLQLGDCNATIERIDDYDCDGVYIKWINRFGGWSYWLFPRANRNRKVKDLGTLENDFENQIDTVSPTVQIGSTSQDNILVTSDIISELEQTILEDLIDSPKVYLFTGEPYAKNNYNDWLEVSVKSTDFRIRNAKHRQNVLNFSIELPQRNTRKI